MIGSALILSLDGLSTRGVTTVIGPQNLALTGINDTGPEAPQFTCDNSRVGINDEKYCRIRRS